MEEGLARVSVIQLGPGAENVDENRKMLYDKAEEIAERERPDFIMGPELCTTQYFCSVCDRSYFEWAEPIPGPTTELFSGLAKKHELLRIY